VHADLLLDVGHLLARGIEPMGSLIELCLRRDAGTEEPVCDRIGAARTLAYPAPPAARPVAADKSTSRLGFAAACRPSAPAASLTGNAEWRIVTLNNVAPRCEFVVAHSDLADAPGDVGADRNRSA
jgi:hypothetical protein